MSMRFAAALLLLAGVARAGDAQFWADALRQAAPRCPSGTVIDVGANGGAETELALETTGYAVLAVECLDREATRLAARWARQPRVRLVRGCASNTARLLELHLADDSSSLHENAVAASALEVAKARREAARTQSALSFPLDSILSSAQAPVCAVKIDTQGHELYVLHGLRNTLRQHRPVLTFEVDVRFGAHVREVLPWVQRRGYVCRPASCEECNPICQDERVKGWVETGEAPAANASAPPVGRRSGRGGGSPWSRLWRTIG